MDDLPFSLSRSCCVLTWCCPFFVVYTLDRHGAARELFCDAVAAVPILGRVLNCDVPLLFARQPRSDARCIFCTATPLFLMQWVSCVVICRHRLGALRAAARLLVCTVDLTAFAFAHAVF
jgi:hypothetical protein